MRKSIPRWLRWTGGALIALPMVFATWPWGSSTWYFITLFVCFFVIGEKIHQYKEQRRHRGHSIVAELGAALAHIEWQKEAFADLENTVPTRTRSIPQRRAGVFALNPGWSGNQIEWIIFSIANFAARTLVRGHSPRPVQRLRGRAAMPLAPLRMP
jgi:hypothetical protein